MDRLIIDIMRENGIPKDMYAGIVETAWLLIGDPDGLWSMLQDHGYDVPFEDVEEIMDLATN